MEETCPIDGCDETHVFEDGDAGEAIFCENCGVWLRIARAPDREVP